MPIIEYYSPDSHKIYQFYARSHRELDEIPKCPDNPSFRMEKMISSFSVTGNSKEEDNGEELAEDDPEMMRAMGEMEAMMSGMNPDNPDPKQMGKVLRRMADLSGEKVDGQLEEMVRRMEEGTPLEALEEEYGEAMGDWEEGDKDVVENSSDTIRKLGGLVRKRNTPVRDPKLYEFEGRSE